MLLTRASCRFGIITPALLRILSVLEEYARTLDLTIIIVSGTDGAHALYSGHQRGEALDFRCRDLVTADGQHDFMLAVLRKLGPEFQGSHEHVGQPNEHYHLQLRRGISFRASAPSSSARVSS